MDYVMPKSASEIRAEKLSATEQLAELTVKMAALEARMAALEGNVTLASGDSSPTRMEKMEQQISMLLAHHNRHETASGGGVRGLGGADRRLRGAGGLASAR